MKKLLYIALAGLSFAACNTKKPTADEPTMQIDTTNHTGSVDSSGMTTNSGKAADTAKIFSTDSAFLANASEVGTFEIAAGKLALKNSTDAQVKALANMMITGHTAMGKDVASVAAKRNITLPAGMGDDLKKEYDKLSSLNGKSFDKEYASVNVKGHKETIDKFQKASKDSNDSPEVQQLATTAIPKLQMHLDHSNMLKDAVNK